MRFLTRHLIKLKYNEIFRYRNFSFVHIYVKGNKWEKYKLKNQSIVCLYKNFYMQNAAIRKFMNKNYEEVYTRFLANLYETKIRLIFIDKDKSYLYEDNRLYELNIDLFNYTVIRPLHQKYINISDFNDNELLDIVNSYTLLNELNEEIEY